jgi:hypothetical protein
VSFQTGTFTNVNDVLDIFATFLTAAGWTIVGNWREPMWTNTTTPGTTYHWRFARRLLISKGNKYLTLQDFYLKPSDIVYGTNGTNKNGPGIALIAGTGVTGGAGGNDAAHPVSGYNTTGPIFIPSFTSDVTAPPSSTTGVIRTVIMPLPMVSSQHTGTWVTGGPMVTDGVEAAPFAVAASYWMMADATGDNVALVILHDNTTTSKTSYLVFGDLRKSGGWAETGVYYGASLSNVHAFTGLDVDGHDIERFGAPASMQDGFPSFLVRVNVDSTTGKWPANTNVALDPGTGRRLSSTTELRASSPNPLGIIANGVHSSIFVGRKGSLSDGAPLIPTVLFAERDSGLWSMIGDIPTIFQANSVGFAPGSEWTNGAGDTYVVFDGFAVKKVP